MEETPRRLCVQTTKSKSKIVYLPLPGDDPKQRKPDITKVRQARPTLYLYVSSACAVRVASRINLLPLSQARKYLGWEPKVPLEEGIIKAAEYFGSLDLS